MSGIGDVTITKGEGGLLRQLPAKDHYVGFVIYCDVKPAGFAASNILEITSLADAVTKGITAAHAEDQIKVLYYHLQQYFAVYTQLGYKPKIWVNIADVPVAAYDYDEIREVVEYSGDEIRMVAVFLDVAFATAMCDAMQTIVTALENAHKPISVLMTADFTAVADLTALSDLRALNDRKISVCFGEDGAGVGAALATAVGYSVSNLGSMLAWASALNISWDIGWPEKFNVIISSEYDTPAFANGDLVMDNQDKIDGVHDKGYVILLKRIGLTGTYFNNPHTCITVDSDYAYLCDNRVIDKAVRGIYSKLIPKLNSPLKLDPDTGKLDILTIGTFENTAGEALKEMVKAQEISGYSVEIDPDQNVQSTSLLSIVVTLVINGVARNIAVQIGFGTTA